MAIEYEFEPSSAMLLVMRVAAQRMEAQADRMKLAGIAKACRKWDDEPGNKSIDNFFISRVIRIISHFGYPIRTVSLG